MSRKHVSAVLVLLAVGGGLATLFLSPEPAGAVPEGKKAALTVYPFLAGGPLDTCDLCHYPRFRKSSASLNPYGIDFDGQLPAVPTQADREAALVAIQGSDSDMDGATNLAEITPPSTFPGGDVNPGKGFRADLSGAAEVPPVVTPASGKVDLKVSSTGLWIDYKIKLKDIVDITGAHIHQGAAGVNGPIVAFLCGGGGAPVCGLKTSGTLMAADLVGPLAGMSIFDLAKELVSGDYYVNVHTMVNPGGEIRGQIGAK